MYKYNQELWFAPYCDFSWFVMSLFYPYPHELIHWRWGNLDLWLITVYSTQQNICYEWQTYMIKKFNYTIMLRHTSEVPWPAYVFIMAANILVLNMHQVISNHADLAVTIVSHQSYYTTYTALQVLNMLLNLRGKTSAVGDFLEAIHHIHQNGA